MRKYAKMQSMEVTEAIGIFPYFIFSEENLTNVSEYKIEVLEIQKYYQIYNKGAKFFTEGSAGTYIPSQIRYKKAKNLIDKEARFMFGTQPDINITEENENDKEQIETYKKIIDKVLENSNFQKYLLQSAKDCFIGKRIAILVDMSEDEGILLHFYKSTEFYYEIDPLTKNLTKFISFETITSVNQSSARRYLVNKYRLENGTVKISCALYNGEGKVITTYITERSTDLKEIPAVVVTNDGTLGDKKGVSEIAELKDMESGYSKLANADYDADRKGMNPVKFLVNINHNTTKNLPLGPGALWDMEENQEIDGHGYQVGQIAPAMNHAEPTKATLDRIQANMHEVLDVPDISQEGLLSGITSFKALKALYYPLMVRCDEKLNTWKPALKKVIKIVIDMAVLNETITKEVYRVADVKEVEYSLNIVENYALLADETEEKQVDMEEIATNSRSRFSYLKKWRGEELKTDADIENELLQIAMEANMMDTLSLNPQVNAELQEQETELEVNKNIEEIKNET